MMANALIDIPSIRRIDKLENVPGRRHSTGKVIMPSGGLTVISRYLRASQGSCHDMCKYGTGFSPETEPKIPRSPMRKIFAPKRVAGRNLERVSESNLGGRRRKSEISGKVSPDCKIQESDDPVVINIEQTQGHHLANVEEDLTDTNNSKVGVEPSDDDPVAINIAQTQERHLENVEGDLTDTKNSKVCVELSNDDPVVINIAPTQGHHLESVQEDLTDRKKFKVRVEPSGNDPVVEPSVSLSAEISNPGVPSMNAKTKKFRNVNRSKKQESAKQVKSEKLRDKKAKRSDNVKGFSHLMGLKNVKKLNSEQAKSANTFETTPAESDQNNVVLIRPYSSSKDKNMNRNQHRILIVQEPHSYEKKKMIYKPKGNHAGGLPPSLSSFPGRKSLRPTPNGLNITQPCLASSSLSASLMSSHNDTSAEHDKAVAKKQKCRPKMMYKARPKKASMITPNNKHLPGKTLNFQRGKVFEIPVEDCTPRRLTFKKRELVDNRIYDNRKGKFEDFSPRRLKFRKRANLDNINADNQNGRVEEFTPRRLMFRQREIVGKRGGDNQNSRIEEFSPRRLEFRRKLIVDNINGDNQNGNVEEFSPRRLEFRRKLIVDNINGDNQNGNVEFSPRKLEFKRKLIVDNINGDNQYGRVEVYSPRKLEFSRSFLDNRNADDQNGSGENYSPRKLIFRPKVVDKKINYVQNTKGSPTKKKIGRKEADVACNNDTKMQSEKISLKHRDVTEKTGSGILYNNIIEQTASKLASTKASKVKALVSAFETVISHLDGSISETDDRN